MKWFMDLKIGKKLSFGFTLVCIIAFIIGLSGFFGAGHLIKDIEEISDIRLPCVYGGETIREAHTSVKAAERTLLIADLPERNVETQYRNIKDAFERAEKGWKIYEPLSKTPEEAELWKQFVPAWNEWKKEAENFVSLSVQYRESKDQKKYDIMIEHNLNKEAKDFKTAEDLLGRIIEINTKVAEEARADARKTGDSVKFWIITAIIAGLAVAFTAAFIISGSITRPLRTCMDAAERIAEGDTDFRLDALSKDETGMLQAAMSKMVAAIKSLINDLGVLSKSADRKSVV
jgi:methyl-accepting chemotaxis protein